MSGLRRPPSRRRSADSSKVVRGRRGRRAEISFRGAQNKKRRVSGAVFVLKGGAEGENRTPTGSLPADFESATSTNSITSATV